MSGIRGISIAMIILYCTNAVYLFLNLFELNLNISLELPVPVIFFAIPAFVILFTRDDIFTIRFPFLMVFIIVESLFLYLESPLFRGDGHLSIYHYAYYLLILYVLVLVFINFGISIDHIEFILKAYLYITICIVLVIFTGYLGLIEYYTDVDRVIELNYRPIGGSMHTNGASMLCVIGIYIVSINKLQGNELLGYSFNKQYFILALYLAMILVNSSRGAFLIAIPALFYYMQSDWNRLSRYGKYGLSYLMIIIILYTIATIFYGEILIIERFQDPTEWTSRLRQIYVTWVNFYENPWVGVGYLNASLNVISGYERSNFHYTQLLASHGLVFFPFFIIFLKKIFGFHIKHGIKFLITFIGFSSLMFYNWTLLFSLSIIIYLKYCYDNK